MAGNAECIHSPKAATDQEAIKPILAMPARCSVPCPLVGVLGKTVDLLRSVTSNV